MAIERCGSEASHGRQHEVEASLCAERSQGQRFGACVQTLSKSMGVWAHLGSGSVRHCYQAPGTLVRSKPARAGSCQARDPVSRPRAPAGAQLSTSAAKTWQPRQQVFTPGEASRMSGGSGREKNTILTSCALMANTESRSRVLVGRAARHFTFDRIDAGRVHFWF